MRWVRIFFIDFRFYIYYGFLLTSQLLLFTPMKRGKRENIGEPQMDEAHFSS